MNIAAFRSEVELPDFAVQHDGPRFSLIPFDEIIPSIDPPFLVKGLIPRKGLTVVWGPPKCGKSFWVFDLVMHVALGWKYRTRRVEVGPVVYVALEGSEGFKARVEAFRQKRLAEDYDPVPFSLIVDQLNLIGDGLSLAQDIASQIDSAPVVIVIDTVNRSLIGSESSDEDMSAYVKAADRLGAKFGCAVVLVHHCGVDGTRPRGHTSLTGAADAQIAVDRAGDNSIRAKVEWLKDGQEGVEILSRLEVVEIGNDTNGDLISSCIVSAVDSKVNELSVSKKPRRRPKGTEIAWRALLKALDECGERAPTSNHIPDGSRVVKLSSWREYAYKSGVSGSEEPRARQKAFQRAVENLNASGDIAQWEELVWARS